MIQACLFDIGNVLVSFDYRRTFPRLAPQTPRSYDEILAHLISFHADLETGRLSSAEFIAHAMNFIGSGVSREEFLDAFTGIFAPVPAVWRAVEALRDTIPVHLFSNTSEIHETSLFRQFPEFHTFHGGFYSWRIGSMKPEDGMYEQAKAVLGLPGDAIAYIDDLPANIETGRRHGFHCHRFSLTEPAALHAFLADCGLPVPEIPRTRRCDAALAPSSRTPLEQQPQQADRRQDQHNDNAPRR